MAYRLKRGEPMATGIRRIVADQIEGAVAGLGGHGDRTEVVHDARKRLKKSRSALRLVRHDLGNGLRRRENKVLRNVGRRLSGVRDAQVLVDTLDGVAVDTAVPAAAARDMRRRLEERRARAEAEAGKGGEQIVTELAQLRARIDDWPLDDESFDSAARGLRRIHRRGKRAMTAALERGDDGSWHEWRKRVKDLWYATRILRPLTPQLEGMVADGDELSDILGDLNDLAVLAAAISDYESELGAEAAEALHAAVRRRRDDLRRRAVPLGTRLYGDSSKALAARLAAAWPAHIAERVIDARWVDVETADQIRALIDARCNTAGTERARLSATLRRRGFGVAALAEPLGRPPRDFCAADWDELVKRGSIRLG